MLRLRCEAWRLPVWGEVTIIAPLRNKPQLLGRNPKQYSEAGLRGRVLPRGSEDLPSQMLEEPEHWHTHQGGYQASSMIIMLVLIVVFVAGCQGLGNHAGLIRLDPAATGSAQQFDPFPKMNPTSAYRCSAAGIRPAHP